MPVLIIQAVLLSALLINPSFAGDLDCPDIPITPEPSPGDMNYRDSWKGVAEPYNARHAVGYDTEPSYGAGYLNVIDSDNYYYDWPRHVTLPLWTMPGNEKFYGWLYSGRVHPDNGQSPYALTGAGLVETEYESSRFIVYESTEDGWLKIRIKPGKEGEAWTHQCYLESGRVKLAYRQWASFLSEHGDWLHFRSRVPHTLREKPGINSPRITLIGLDHKLILHEIRGDWMRVTVEQPDRTCNGAERYNKKALVHEGWIKWRDDQKGPWVYVYTRGC